MKAVLVVLLAAVSAAPTLAHTYSEHGNITAPAPVGTAAVFVALESIAPGSVPNGLFYYVIRGVEGGDSYSLSGDDGQEPFVVGTADECPGPSTFDPTNPDWWLNDFWLYCRNHPDFEVWFTCTGRQGDGSGTVPCDGDAIVFLAWGDPGEGFTWSESP